MIHSLLTYLAVCISAEIPLPNEQARMEIMKIHAAPIAKHGEIGVIFALLLNLLCILRLVQELHLVICSLLIVLQCICQNCEFMNEVSSREFVTSYRIISMCYNYT